MVLAVDWAVSCQKIRLDGTGLAITGAGVGCA